MRSKNSKPCSQCSRPAVARGLCHTHYMHLRRAGLLESLAETDEQFISSRVLVDQDGHWLWQRSTWNGYGRMVRRGVSMPAHVFSFLAHGGTRNDGEQINHTCHIRNCVNPAHLYSGTQKDNMRDMRSAGRSRILRGSDNGMSKIDAQAAIEIRESRDPARHVAARHGVSMSLVYAIRRGRVWRHVE